MNHGRFQPPSVEELAARGLGPDGKPLKTQKTRARNDDGTLKADDPSTPDVNGHGKKSLQKSVVA